MTKIEECTKDSWQSLWQAGDTPWTGEKVNDPFYAALGRLLELSAKPASAIAALVPLCGNSPAVRFLYDRGADVTAIDYVPEAIDQLRTGLFTDIAFDRTDSQAAAIYTADRLTLIVQDFFAYAAERRFDLIYDRGGFVAVPPRLQEDYAKIASAALRPGGVIFLRCAEFIGGDFAGPPFSVGSAEVRSMFASLEVVEEQLEIAEPTQDRLIAAGVKQTAWRNFILRLPVS